MSTIKILYFCSMILTDSHTHLYLEHFDKDRKEVINRAIDSGIEYMLLPNIDSKSVEGMLAVCEDFPENCFPMMGLHPTNVKEDFEKELENVKKWLDKKNFVAVGEIGIDLYWDKTFFEQQVIALKNQIDLAKKHQLPIVIHARNSMEEIFEVLKEVQTPDLKGVFHCFSGNLDDAFRAIDMGYYLGIGGVITYKKSNLPEIVREIELESILLETDAPFLSPVPFRGKRNESAYINYIAEKIAEIKSVSIQEVAEITTQNAKELFNF